jgi:hypothetical protein
LDFSQLFVDSMGREEDAWKLHKDVWQMEEMTV